MAVFPNRPIRRELAAPRHIQDRHLRPPFLVLPCLVHLALAAHMIRSAVSDLPVLIQLLELSNQKRLAKALRSQPPPTVRNIGGQPHPNAQMWREGRVR